VTSSLSVSGTVRVPGDKSISHRALLFAALAHGPSRVRAILSSADVHSTADVLRALGVSVPELSDDFVVQGHGPRSLRQPRQDLDCGNSGTTTRLVAGIVAGRENISARFVGDASLSKRPMKRIARPLMAMGAQVESEFGDGLPMYVSGAALHSINWRSEHASAQIKSAIMLAAVSSGVAVTVSEPTRSRDHTERMLAARGVALHVHDTTVTVPEGAYLHAADTDVPADPSSAAFFVALAGLSQHGELVLPDVCLNPTRTGGFDILRRMGVRVRIEDQREVGGEILGTLIVSGGSLFGTSISGDEVPRAIDELPLIACVAARADGETRITGASELRVKESDRIAAVVNNLHAIGVDAEELPDGMVVRGGSHPLRGNVITHGDHRLAMSFGILGALPGNDIHLDDPECVAVSFPDFWSALDRVVGNASRPVSRASETSDVGAMSTRLVIAIDGPAASGKSSTSQWVAKRLGVRHVDSGAFYRALTAAALRSGLPAEQWTEASVLSHAPRIGQALTERSVVPTLDGDTADAELRGSAVTAEVSRIARMPAARVWVNDRVRVAGASSNVVVDGRDIGTVVFPDASLKVFLIADPWERARRRLVQRLERRPTDVEIAEETEALVARDAKDATQSRPDPAAVTIDTTTLTQEEQVERIVALAEAVRPRPTRS